MDRMLAEMPAGMLAEWMAFDMMEPIDLAWRFDLMLAKLTSLMANMFGRRKNTKAFELQDFMPKFERKKPLDPADTYALLRTWAILNGAKNNADHQPS